MTAAERAPRRGLVLLAGLGLALVATTLAGPALHAAGGVLAFALLAIGQGLLALLALRIALGCATRPALAVIAVVAVALRLALLPVAPHLSSDAYRYVWDGRVQAAGINPYRHLPADPALDRLRDAAIFPNINRADYAVTIYPPAAQMLFLAVNTIADGMLALKLAFLACEALTVLVLLDLLRRLGRPAVCVLAYAWHPLAVWETAGSAHVDAAMVAAMMLGLWLALAGGRRLAGAAVLAVAALLKPPAALALAAVWRGWDWRAPAVAIGVALALYLPYLSVGAGVIGFLPAYLEEERIDGGGGFWLVASLQAVLGPIPLARPIYLAAAALAIGGLALRVALHPDRRLEAVLTRLFWLLLAFVMLLSPNYAWYYLILVPFVALLGPAPGWAATIACFLLYDVFSENFDVDFPLREAVINLAVVATLPFAIRARSPAPRHYAGEPAR